MSDIRPPAGVDFAKLNGMSADEIIEAFGGYDKCKAFYEQAAYVYLHPKKCQDDLIELARYLMPDPNHPGDSNYSRYHVARHHRLIAEAFERVISGKCLRLILSIPPQHGKSQLAKTFLSAHVGKFAWKHLMMGTYNQDFANEYGEDLRAILRSEEYQRVFPESHLRTGSKAKDHMVTTRGGKISFLGRGGSGTGRPADGFLIDDPLKDAKEAGSKAMRDDVWEWFGRVANTRCHSLTWQVIIATRWSDDDLIGRLTDPNNPFYKEEVAKQWTVINVPAEIDDPEMARAFGVEVGSALWPERFPLHLLRTAKIMDPLGYSALYMGRPTPPEGSFYKMTDFEDCFYGSAREFPGRARMYQTGDLAVSAEMRADKSCVGHWGLDEHDTLWLHHDLYWDRRSSDESVDEMIKRGKDHNIMEAYYEKGQLDKAIGPFLEKRMEEMEAYWTLTRLPVAGDKAVRSLSFRGRLRQGKVKFPRFATWWPRALDQMMKFTGSGNDKEDDFCDMCGLIGAALGNTVKGDATKKSNVIAMPKPGTFGWTKWAHDMEQRRNKRLAALKGM